MQRRSARMLLLILGLLGTTLGRVTAAPPSAPTLLAPADGASVQVPFTISWTPVSDPAGIAGYNWQVSASASFAQLILQDATSGDTAQDTVSGLPRGTYFWRVQAANGAMEQSPWSAVRSFTVTGAGPGTPGTPTLDPTVGYSTFHPWETVRFTWSAIPDAARYTLQFSNHPDFPVGATPQGITTGTFDNIATNSSSYVHAMDEGTWYVRVWAVSAAGVNGLPSNTISYTVFYTNPVPDPPVLTAPLDNPTLTLPITLRWEHVVNPQPMGYDLEISSSSSFTNNEAPLGTQLTNPEFHIKSLTSGTKFWRVRSNHGLASRNPDGTTTNATTAWSATGSFTISAAPPTPVSIMPVRTPLYSGDETAVELQLTAGVPPGGATVALSSSNPAVVPVPATIQIQGTHAWTQFQIRAGQVTAPTPVTLTASLNGASASGQFTVHPPSLKSLTVASPDVSGGTTVGAILNLNGQAPAGGAVVSLESSSPAAAPPSTVTVPAGVCCTPISIPTSDVTASTPATLTARWNGVAVQQQITVRPSPAPTSFSLFPSTTVGGEGSVDGTVAIASAAAYDQSLRMTSTNPAVVPFLSSSVTVPAGSTRGFVRIFPATVSEPTVVTISVSGGGVTRSADLTVNPPGTPPPPATLAGFTVSPSSVPGGTPATGTVTLPSPAPAGGSEVLLGSNLPGAASVPPSVTVPAGSTSASFTITTYPVAQTTVQLSARLGDSLLFAALGVGPAAPSVTLSGVTVNPTTVVGGTSATGTVTLSAAAPGGGAAVSLSDDASAATVPASVTVPAGATSATFTISTGTVAAPTPVTITASYAGVTRTTSFTLNPPTPAAPSLISPAADARPAQPVTFDWSDAAHATSYELQIDDSSTLAPPYVRSTTVTGSQTTIGGLPATRLWWRVRGVNAAGVFGPFSSTRRFTPQAASTAPALSALTLAPTTVVGGNTVGGTVTLTAAAPTGGAVVALTSSNSAASVPGSVTVAAGATSASFTVSTQAVTASTGATISGSYGGVTRSATLTVTPPAAPPALSAISVDPASVVGGQSSQGTVTLTAAAPAGGFVVALSSSQGAASVPGSVTVPSGATSTTFAVSTSSVTASTSVTITASAGDVVRTAALTVTAPPQSATLTLAATGRSGERVLSNPAGLNVLVGSSGSATFATGTSITLSASNNRDVVWSGACSSGGNKAKTCTMTLTGNASVTASVQ